MSLGLATAFLDALVRCLGEMGIELAQAPEPVGGGSEVPFPEGCAAVISFAGSARGAFALGCTVDLAAAVGRGYAGIAAPSPEECRAVTAELANIVAGNAAGALAGQGVGLQIRPPEGLPGDATPRSPEAWQEGRYRLRTCVGDLEMALTVWGTREAPPRPRQGVRTRGEAAMDTDVTGTRVLVVDDSAITQRMVASALSEAGCEVVGFAANGAEALAAYVEKRPDVVTLDLIMPQMDGFEALRLLKGRHPEAVVIIISSISMKHRIIECVKAGASHYLLKPFTKEKVRQVLSETLAKVRAASSRD